MKLFKIEFPFNTKLFNYEDKRTCDINYFLGRMYISKKEIWEQEIYLLLNVFDAKEILSCLSKDNITYKNSNNNIMEFKSFVEKKLKNLL
jgi:hypothetical protein